MAIVVQKYGGTSVEGRERLMAIAKRVAALRKGGEDVVVVVSAPGRSTDSLLEQARALAPEPSQRELDMLMTAGERISMSLLSIALNSIGCPAVSFTGSQVGIITDTRHTDARILEVRPGRLVRELESGNVVVVGGFQGVSTAKDVTTLGRGGSDTTAVALAAALGAARCEILTDVDGVYTADPNVVATATRIDEISYEDMCELARHGATVLKEEAVRFAERHGIELDVGKSGLEVPGTIVLDSPTPPDRAVVGLSRLTDVELVTWESASASSVVSQLRGSGGLMLLSISEKMALAAVERRALEPLLERLGENTAVRKADLICAVGSEAGSAESAAAAVEAVASVGAEVFAMTSRGRSTVLAVGPELSERALVALHAAFFPSDG